MLGACSALACNTILGVDQDYEVGVAPTTATGSGGTGGAGGPQGGGATGGTPQGGQGGQGAEGGVGGGAFAPELDGVDDFILTNRPLADELTVEAWIRTTVEGSGTVCWQAVPVIHADQVGNVADFSSCILAGGRFGFSIGRADAGDEVLASDDPVNTGQWVHVAGAKGSDGRMYVYVNGAANGQRNTAVTAPIVGPEQILFGGNLIDGLYFTGRIREVRLWNRARTAEEVSQDYAQRLVGDEPGLIGYWPLDEGTGVLARDLTVHANHATLGGGIALSTPAWVADGPPLE